MREMRGRGGEKGEEERQKESGKESLHGKCYCNLIFYAQYYQYCTVLNYIILPFPCSCPP
jgi:hypothetical protein